MPYCRKCHKSIPEESVFCMFCGSKQSSASRTRRGNGLGTAWKYRAGWRAEVTVGYDENGRRIKRTKSGFKTKKEALEYLPILAQRPEIVPRTLKYYYDSWSKTDAPKLSSSKQTAYRVAWNKMSDIHLTNVKDLTIVQLRDLVSEVAPTFYPARDIKSLMSHLLKLAVADQQITVNMSEYITLPKQKDSERTPWNDDELKIIWKAYDEQDPIAAYLLLMIYSGMMPGEMFDCPRECIHLDKRQIIGAGKKTDIRKKTPIVYPTFIIPVIERILTYTEDDPKRQICFTDRWSFYDSYHDLRNSTEFAIYLCTAAGTRQQQLSRSEPMFPHRLYKK